VAQNASDFADVSLPDFSKRAGGRQGKNCVCQRSHRNLANLHGEPGRTGQVQVTNLAPTDDDGLFPTLSPDGRKILFNYNGGEGPDLYVINVNGTGLQALTNDHGSLFGHWSPDGKKIAFATVSPRGPGVIAVMPANGKGKRKILTTDEWESVVPIYTPDGKQIVFTSQMGGYVSAVWIMNSDGSHQRRLTAPALKAAPSAVSPEQTHPIAQQSGLAASAAQ
jgi:Tol biopolymer transport system component